MMEQTQLSAAEGRREESCDAMPQAAAAIKK